jgi:hypothetical protein
VEGSAAEGAEFGGRGESEVYLEPFLEEERAVGRGGGVEVEVVQRAQVPVGVRAPVVECFLHCAAGRHGEEQVDVRPAVLGVSGGGAGDRGAGDPLVLACR